MMIKVYYLRQLKDEVAGIEYTEGSEHISQAISEATEEPDVRRVIIEENPDLANIALMVKTPTKRDLEKYDLLPKGGSPRNLVAEIDDLKTRVKQLEK